MIGTTVSHYRILEKLGEGGMGIVYKAQDLKLDRLVALKFLPHHLTANEAEKARFLQEARAASSLNHPNVCTIYGIEEHEGQQFIEMEYVDGVTLRQKFSEAPLKMNDALSFAIQTGEALGEAHGKGIVHRDIKADNIMVNTKNQVKVMDFGLAKLKGALKLTRTSSTAGTLAYMAPEQIQGGEVDARSDIFSFGVVLFEMLTGRLPFRGDHETAMMYSILNEEPEPLQKTVPDASPELLHVLNTALEKQPEDRYQTVTEMVRDLRRAQRKTSRVSRAFDSAALIPQTEIGSETKQRNLKLVFSYGGMALLFAALAFAIYWGFIREEVRGRFLTPTQLTANPIESSITGAAISPDGKYLAYCDRTGLYLRLIARGEIHPISLPAGFRPWSVAWFPDGTRLLFVAYVTGSDEPSLWTTSILGGSPRKLRENVSKAVVSPDGEQIAILSLSTAIGLASREIVVMKSSGVEARKLVVAGPGEMFWQLAWSPNAKWLAYATWQVGPEGTKMKIETRSLDGNQTGGLIEEPRLFQSWTGILPFVWTADGRIIYARRDEQPNQGYSNLWSVKADISTGKVQGEPTRLTQLVSYNFRGLDITADAKRLICLLARNQADVFVGELTDGGRRLINERHLTFDERNDYPTAFMPDGRTVFFDSERGGTGDVYAQKVNQQIAEIVAGGPGTQRSGRPSPDGSWLLFWSGNNLMRIPITGGVPEQVLSGGGWFRCPSTPNADCVFTERDTKNNELVFSTFHTIQGRGKELRRIADRPPFSNWDLSPDGSKVAVVHNDNNQIRIINLQSGKERVVEVQGWKKFEFVAWAINGEGMYVNGVSNQQGGYAALLYVDMQGRAYVLRQKENEWHLFPVVSSDGRYLAFGVMPFHTNVWMLEGF